MRQRFCRSCGGWHELDKWPHNCMTEARGAPSDDLPVPHFISDTIDTVQSMADGRYYSSKAALKATYLPSGNPQGERFLEVGNEPIRAKPQPRQDTAGIRDAIKSAVAQVGG